MEVYFHIADYVVMGLFLLISLGIGIYYGLIRKQKTTEEYLLGNRQMQLLPVALSMMVTYQSAISVIGVPAEVYLYNTMFLYIYVGLAVASVIQYCMIVPLMYPLRLTSAYEYLGRRFESRAVQLMGAVLGMLQTLLYMSVVLLAPALALEAVIGLPMWISVILVGIIGTIYTSLGGIKSVIWTDVFQFVILFVGLIAILILSRIKLGTFDKIYDDCVAGERIVFNDFSGDPRVRHTLWSLVIGGSINWLPNLCNQSSIQRICSIKTLKQSKMAALLSVPLVLLYGALLCLTGMVMFAYFANEGCDPLAAGMITNGNQITPYFVMHVLTDIPGLAGLFIAALFSGSLSSLSSGINAMAANTIEDLLVNCLKNTSQWGKTLTAKLIVIVYGAIVITLAYMAQYLAGSITQIALSAMGAIGGPVLGMIYLGGIFPQANWIGAIGGGTLGIAINVWISICSVLIGTKSPRSQSIGVKGCFGNVNVSMLPTDISTESMFYSTTYNNMNITMDKIGNRLDDPGHLALYDVSYLYFGMIGFFTTIIFGIIISLIVGVDKYVAESEYIFPCMRGFWRAGYKGLQIVPTYQAFRMKPKAKNGALADGPIAAPIKALDFSLYNKVPEADL